LDRKYCTAAEIGARLDRCDIRIGTGRRLRDSPYRDSNNHRT